MSLRAIIVVSVLAIAALIALIAAASPTSQEIASIKCDRLEGERASILELPAENGTNMQVVSVHKFDTLPNPRVSDDTKEVIYSDWIDQDILQPIDDHKYEALGGFISCHAGVIKVQVKANGIWQVWDICYYSACPSRKPVHR